jgi:dihydroorotase-like cyclic amidohydrolase
MSVDLVLKNARLVTPLGVHQAGLAVKDGKIVAIAEDAQLPRAQEQIDCGGKVVLPGLVDPHVHMGGVAPYEQNCLTECESAAAGGVTTVLQYFRSASRSFLETFSEHRATAQQHFFLDTAFHFIISGLEQALEIPEYARRFGVTSFKFYMGGYAPGNPVGIVTTDDGVLYAAMERIRQLGPHAFCMVHCEDQGLVMLMTERAKRSGRQDLMAYTQSRPAPVEEQDVLRAIWMAELLECPLYIPHVTVGRAIEAAMEARGRGHRVLLETCPHYLALTADDERLAAQGPGVGKVSPPLRDKANQERLWWGLANGYIQTVGSDHVPIRKSGGALWEERPGFAGLATILPVLLTDGVLKGRLTLERVAEVTALNPARLFGFYPPKGAIAVGFDADLVVVDLEREATVGPETTHSRYTSAFEGVPLRGWPVLTMRRGEAVFKDGQVLGRPGSGRVLERNASPATVTAG